MAGTFYVLLTGDYMKTDKKSDGIWVLKKPLARYSSFSLNSCFYYRRKFITPSSVDLDRVLVNKILLPRNRQNFHLNILFEVFLSLKVKQNIPFFFITIFSRISSYIEKLNLLSCWFELRYENEKFLTSLVL